MPDALEKLTKRDSRLIWICVAASVLSLWITIGLFFQVFPEASIEFNVNRESSLKIARDFLFKLNSQSRQPQGNTVSHESHSLGNVSPLDLSGYRHAAIFDYDEIAKIYLERELGLERANQVLGREVRLWRWKHRWFRSLEKEEFQVDVSTRGEISRFQHLIEENAPGADLIREQAQTIAEDFLHGKLHRNLGQLEFIEFRTEKRQSRTDHFFQWKAKEFAVADAQYRFSVTIHGNQVGGYEEYLKVPDDWIRGYQKLRSLNETTATVDFIFLFLTLLAMLVMLVRGVRKRDIHWRTAAYFGMTAFVLTFLSRLNSLPLSEFGYDTTDSYRSFWAQMLLNAIIVSAGSGAAIFLITASAEPLYRHNYGQRVSLSNLFRWRGLRSKEFFTGTLVGLTLTFFFFAYDSIFYLIARKLGAWAPADVPYSDLLNTRIPWAFVLFFGFFPAVSEEFISRMFSVPFFEKILRYRWLAVGLASLIWGFGHASYPNQPFYIRGIEVGIGGIIVSLVFLRFGIVAPLVWHYSVDALFTAFLLFKSQNLYLIVSGALSAGIMLIPFFIALFTYLKNRGFVVADRISNASENLAVAATEPPKTPIEEITSIPYAPLSDRRRWILVGFALALLIPSLLKLERFGDFVDISITRSQARRIAEDFLGNQGIHWTSFRSSVAIEQFLDPVAAQYVLKHFGVSVLNQIYSQKVKSYSWMVRFYKPLEEEEYRVFIDPRQKSAITFEHIISENAPAPSVDKAAAQRLAEDFLMTKRISLSQFELKEANSEKRKARQDYVFVWESKIDRFDDAALRLRVHLQGNRVSSYSTFIKVPEEWRRDREKSTVLDTLLGGLRLALIAFLSGWGFWTFLQKARQGLIRWKPVLTLAVGLVLAEFLGDLNALAGLFQRYPTSVAPDVFVVRFLSTLLISKISLFLYYGALLGLASALAPECWWVFRRENRLRFAKDALCISTVVLIGYLGLTALSDHLVLRFHDVALLPDFTIAPEADHYVPAFSICIRAFHAALVYSSLIVIVIYVLRQVLKQELLRALFLFLISLSFLPKEAVTPGEFFFSLGWQLLVTGLVVLLLFAFLRQNLPAYLTAFFFLSLFHGAYFFFSQTSSFFRWNGYLLFAVGGLILAKSVYDAYRLPTDGWRNPATG